MIQEPKDNCSYITLPSVQAAANVFALHFFKVVLLLWWIAGLQNLCRMLTYATILAPSKVSNSLNSVMSLLDGHERPTTVQMWGSARSQPPVDAQFATVASCEAGCFLPEGSTSQWKENFNVVAA